MRRKEKHTFYNYQFKHTAVKITDHPHIQSIDVEDALGIHPIMLYRWRQEMREGKIQDNKTEARSRTELLDAKARIRTLERQLKALRDENVILKKADGTGPLPSEEAKMNKRQRVKFVHEGKYVAEVDVELLEDETEWSPYLSVDDAYKLDDVRDALRRGDIAAAAKRARVFSLQPVAVSQ